MKRDRDIYVSAALSCFFCYFYLWVNGHGGPDAVSEGVRYYHNAGWATATARWMIRYINTLFGKNVILPFITVILYCAMIAVSCCMLVRLFDIRSKLFRVLLSAALVSFPVVTDQFAYLYMALSYSLSFLLVVLGCMLVRKKKPLPLAGSVLCFLLMLGSYQAYIAAIAALGLLLFFKDVCGEEKLRSAWLKLGLTAGSALAAALVNFPLSSWMANHYGTGFSERVSDFSLSVILENLSFSVPWSYIWFFTPFDTDVLSRGKLYLLVFILLGIAVIALLVKLCREKKWLRAVLALLSVLLLPLAMNACEILFPANGLFDIMRYHYVLIFVLLFSLLPQGGAGESAAGLSGAKKDEVKKEGGVYAKLAAYVMRGAAAVVTTLLIATWTISANATFILNGVIYDYTCRQATMMLEQVYTLDGYEHHATPIILGGPIAFTDLEGIYSQLFRYGRIGGGPVFWNNAYGMTTGRYHFFREYMGLEPLWVDVPEYEAIVNSEEFAAMPVWPAKGSVAMIGGYAVIKNTDDPPR